MQPDERCGGSHSSLYVREGGIHVKKDHCHHQACGFRIRPSHVRAGVQRMAEKPGKVYGGTWGLNDCETTTTTKDASTKDTDSNDDADRLRHHHSIPDEGYGASRETAGHDDAASGHGFHFEVRYGTG